MSNEKKQEAQAPAEVKASSEEKAPAKKKQVKLDDTILVNVKSNTFGKLIYVNPRTGDRTVWDHYGDVQTLSMGDLRAMKGTQRAFYENQWIFIVDIADGDYEDVSADDIYKALLVSQYYKNVIDPSNFAKVFTMDTDKIKERVAMMSKGARLNLIVAAGTAIKNGQLDSLKRIKTLEEVLGCELERPE